MSYLADDQLENKQNIGDRAGHSGNVLLIGYWSWCIIS